MPRQARLDAPGTLHHVIVRGIEKRRIVDDDTDRTVFLERLGNLSLETDTRIYAWALLTNHIHLLLKSSSYGLSRFMSRCLTGYAVRYNRRHARHGHLFQNRYKSIVCEEDAYFKELVRYIHLNPLRARLVQSTKELARYPWCGHATILGHQDHIWHDRQYVLDWFGRGDAKSKAAYLQFVEEGVTLGHQPALVGGGLIRSMGGWSQVQSMRKLGVKDKSDERILGSGEFVESLLSESDAKISRQFAETFTPDQIKEVISAGCAKEGITMAELTGGSRRAAVSAVRAGLALELIKTYGLTPTEVGRQIGVTLSAISRIIQRAGRNKFR